MSCAFICNDLDFGLTRVANVGAVGVRPRRSFENCNQAENITLIRVPPHIDIITHVDVILQVEYERKIQIEKRYSQS